MKRFRRCACFFLAIIITLATPAFAVESDASRGSSYFICSSVYLYKTSDSIFEVWFEVSAYGVMEELGASSIEVQRSRDGENWMTMKTYSRWGYSQLICENTGAHTACVNYIATEGYYYRAKIVLYAKDEGGFGEMTEYTATMQM